MCTLQNPEARPSFQALWSLLDVHEHNGINAVPDAAEEAGHAVVGTTSIAKADEERSPDVVPPRDLSAYWLPLDLQDLDSAPMHQYSCSAVGASNIFVPLKLSPLTEESSALM